MKGAFIFCGVIALLLTGFLIWQHRANRPGPNISSAINGNIGVTSVSLTNQRPPSESQAQDGFPYDARPEVQQLYQLAHAANLYNFDPKITSYEDITTPIFGRRTNRVTGKLIGTPTHSASVTGGVLDLVVSARDCSNPLDPSEEGPAMRQWYKCTGKMSEKEAVDETLAILSKIGANMTLAALKNGHHEYRALPMRLKNPNGDPVNVTPFIIVDFYTTNNRHLVGAEYRMGSNGSAGLTRWYHWPPKEAFHYRTLP